MDNKLIISALNNATNILRDNIANYDDNFFRAASINQLFPIMENKDWTTGFITGQYWLAYEYSNDNLFKNTALKQVESFYDRIINHIEVDHHDMGFLYTPSCVAAYKLTANECAKNAALKAADQLISRFHPTGQFIQAWGPLGIEENYRLIIDCLLNLPLLYWATEVTNDPKYSEIARLHTNTSLANLIRPDHSTFHTFFFDKTTGAPTHGITHQGYRNDSAWARGQAWGIYGTALSYQYTKDPKCISLFKQVTDFFIEHLPTDHIVYWDLEFNDPSNEPKDSSASAIAVCGILHMIPYLDSADQLHYQQYADLMMTSLITHYANSNSSLSNGLLLHGVYAKSSPFNPIKKDNGVDECNSWGDYFYLEALLRYYKSWEPYW